MIFFQVGLRSLPEDCAVVVTRHGDAGRSPVQVLGRADRIATDRGVCCAV
jgi:hypothetical protein